jgi:hypothetical protein
MFLSIFLPENIKSLTPLPVLLPQHILGVLLMTSLLEKNFFLNRNISFKQIQHNKELNACNFQQMIRNKYIYIKWILFLN